MNSRMWPLGRRPGRQVLVGAVKPAEGSTDGQRLTGARECNLLTGLVVVWNKDSSNSARYHQHSNWIKTRWSRENFPKSGATVFVNESLFALIFQLSKFILSRNTTIYYPPEDPVRTQTSMVYTVGL